MSNYFSLSSPCFLLPCIWWRAHLLTRMGESACFQFIPVVGASPEYTFMGGTRAVSEMGGLGVGGMLQYVHGHWTPVKPASMEEGKSKEAAVDMLHKSRLAKGLAALRLIHKALRLLPREEEQLEKEMFEFQEEVIQGLGLGERDTGKSEDWISEKLQVEWGKGRGRYVVTSAPIEVGEELVRESPVVCLLHHSHLGANCFSCLRPLLRAVSCPTCSSVLFCSDACRKSASTSHHRLECGHLHLLPGSGPLAPPLRLVTSCSREESLQVAAELSQLTPPQPGLLAEQGGILGLQAGCKNSSQYRIDKAAHAYYLVTILKSLGFFENNNDNAFEEEHLAIGALLNHYIKISDDNCHEISELSLPRSGRPSSFDELFQEVEEVIQVVGVAIYPRMSLFNNCCDVNTVKYQQGKQEVLVAKRDIAEGEEISDFYGEHFFQSDKWSRKAALGFPCACRACREGWSLLEELPRFNVEETEERLEWAVARVALEQQLAGFNVEEVGRLCRQLGRLAKVEAPHEALVLPGIYLHYATLFLHANASLTFQLAFRQPMDKLDLI